MNKVIMTFLVCIFYLDASGQNENTYFPGLWGYNYEVGIPLGETRDFIDNMSFRGFSLGGKKFINEHMAMGGSVGWHVFNEKKDNVTAGLDFVIEFEDGSEGDVNGAISGDQYRYINSFPFMINLQYFNLNPARNSIAFYAGLGLGTQAIKRRVEVGVLAVDDTNWHFGIIPEIGFIKRFNTTYYFNGGVKYNQAFSSGGRKYSYLNITIGFYSEF